VDGRVVKVKQGAMLLGILQEMGIPVPTLCHHPSLTPNGACRLCVVEITHPDWKGWSRLVTSCLYPAEPDLQVLTHSKRVQDARRTLLELYLAQCPNAEEVRILAQQEGVDTTPFPKKEAADNCVLCGLCTRVCQDLGPAAISSLGRGTEKTVGPKPDRVGEDCTGCGTCAHICPTNAIPIQYKNQKLSIWNREFDVPVCSVKPENCRGCGICEEVCPYSIPRVVVYKTGAAVAGISHETCVGCGICA
ncbi:MAG: 4Fe-4S dicluster domain-containing protein, partial [bacterium]|nr:4Fe-4S dicluster domain-containing protein [bacterium]